MSGPAGILNDTPPMVWKVPSGAESRSTPPYRHPTNKRQAHPQVAIPCGLQERRCRVQTGAKEELQQASPDRPLPELPAGTEVWTTTNRQPTEGIAAPHPTALRSYTVSTSCGTVRRNRSQLNVIPQPNLQEKPTPPQDPPTQERALTRSPIQTRSRTGTPIVRPQRL